MIAKPLAWTIVKTLVAEDVQMTVTIHVLALRQVLPPAHIVQILAREIAKAHVLDLRQVLPPAPIAQIPVKETVKELALALRQVQVHALPAIIHVKVVVILHARLRVKERQRVAVAPIVLAIVPRPVLQHVLVHAKDQLRSHVVLVHPVAILVARLSVIDHALAYVAVTVSLHVILVLAYV